MEAEPDNIASADRIIEQFRIEPRSRQQIQEAITNVRSYLGSGPLNLQESAGDAKPSKNFNNLGVDFAELKRRMPIGDKRY
jgi:hypothetical protein